jgi:hypothetical protein
MIFVYFLVDERTSKHPLNRDNISSCLLCFFIYYNLFQLCGQFLRRLYPILRFSGFTESDFFLIQSRRITLRSRRPININVSKHGRMARGGHGLPKVSLRPAMPCPTLLRPAGGPSLKWPHDRLRDGSPAGQAACGRLLPL